MAKKKKEAEIKIVAVENDHDIQTGVMIDGEVCVPGDTVTVGLQVARNLVNREKAIIYTDEVKEADILEQKEKLAAELKASKKAKPSEEASDGKEK
ncbi:hypothetical protein D0S45_17415 [Marinifilum sp. JC120]|nr:hypothetical protein D0S45_17415 [Marinifilum sp. JC120]